MSELFRRTALGIQRLLNHDDPASRGVDPALADRELAPVFIVGPPRSGTTLLYQALSRTAQVSYISNVMAVAPMFMVRLGTRTERNRPAPDAPFERGNFGFLPGLYAPSEAGKVIDRWFHADAYLARRDNTRRMIAAIGQRTGQPLLIKAIPLGLNLDRVLAVFPQARFVYLKREPIYVVQSLFKGQSDPNLATDRWEGLQPEGFEAHAGRGIEFQTAWQIAEILRLIENGLKAVSPNRIARVKYENFCADPTGTVTAIGRRLGLLVNPDGLPQHFPVSGQQTVSDEQWQLLTQACVDTGLT